MYLVNTDEHQLTRAARRQAPPLFSISLHYPIFLPDTYYPPSLYRDLLFWLLSIFPLEFQRHKGRALVLPRNQYLAPSRCSLRSADCRRRAEAAANLEGKRRNLGRWGESGTVRQEAQLNSDLFALKGESWAWWGQGIKKSYGQGGLGKILKEERVIWELPWYR